MILRKIYIFLTLFLLSSMAYPQSTSDSLETLLKKSSGLGKVIILEQLVTKNMNVAPMGSIIYAKEGLSLSENLNLTDKKIIFLSQLGLGCRLIGNYNQSLEYYLKALPLVEDKNKPLEIAKIRNEIGNVYNYLGNFDKALMYYEESMQIREIEHDTLGIAKSLNNIGNIYKNTNKLSLALQMLFKSLDYKILTNDKDGIAPTQKNIGSVYTKLGKLDTALIYFEKALASEMANGDSLGVINSFILMATAYYENNKLDKAEQILLRALQMAEKAEIPYYRMNSNYLLYQVYEKKHNYEKSLKHLQNYLTVRNKIFNAEKHKQSLEIEMVYNLNEKEKIVTELELNKKTLQTNIFVIISITSISAVVIFIFIYRDKIRNSNEIKKKNLELNSAIEKSEKANQMKSDFLAQMSHEIRTPINTIVNYTSLLKTEFENKVPEDLEDSFSSIEKAAKRLLRTIDLILNMSDIESGTYETIFKKMEVFEEIIEPIYLEFYNNAKSKGLEFKIINELSEDPVVEADVYTISQIMANLVDNAIKYTAAGKIEIRLYLLNDKPAIDISDTGIGISEKYIPKLFTKFSQEDQGYTRKFEGTGLGLSLVKRYCEINNCEIFVKSKKGEGTTFTLMFQNY